MGYTYVSVLTAYFHLVGTYKLGHFPAYQLDDTSIS
jgi:hypothetical protein